MQFYLCSSICLAIDEITTAAPHTASSRCTEGILGLRGRGELRPGMQHHGQTLRGAAAGLCVPSESPVRHQRSWTLHRVRDPRLSFGGCRAIRPHGQATHAARRVCAQRKVPSALLGPELRRVAAVLLPSAELRARGPAEVGAERQAALAGDTECGCSAFKDGTRKAD